MPEKDSERPIVTVQLTKNQLLRMVSIQLRRGYGDLHFGAFYQDLAVLENDALRTLPTEESSAFAAIVAILNGTLKRPTAPTAGALMTTMSLSKEDMRALIRYRQGETITGHELANRLEEIIG